MLSLNGVVHMLSVSNYYIWSHFFMVLFNMADIVKVSHVDNDI